MKKLDDAELWLLENDPEFYYDQVREDIYDILESSEDIDQDGEILEIDERLTFEDFSETYGYQPEN
jgi:hypothetical protein